MNAPKNAKFTRQQFAEAICKLSADMGGGHNEMHAIINGCLQAAVAGVVACGGELEPLLENIRMVYAHEAKKTIPKRN